MIDRSIGLYISLSCSCKMLYSLNNILLYNIFNCIGGVMVSMLASSAVDRGFEPNQKL